VVDSISNFLLSFLSLSLSLRTQHYYPDGGNTAERNEQLNCETTFFKFLISSLLSLHTLTHTDWGWIVCSVAFLAHILTTGFQLSYGFLLLYAIKHLGQEAAIEASEC
jgi:hypothetical protein